MIVVSEKGGVYSLDRIKKIEKKTMNPIIELSSMDSSIPYHKEKKI